MNIKIKNNKVYLIPIIAILIVIITVVTLIININRVFLYISWKVFLPQPEKVDTIYMHDWREGQDFEIWHYTPKKSKKVILHKSFLPMDSVFIKEKLEDYHKLLGESEEEKLFTKNISDTILDDKNYYAYIPEKVTVGESQYVNYLILILDTKTNSLYVLSHVGY